MVFPPIVMLVPAGPLWLPLPEPDISPRGSFSLYVEDDADPGEYVVLIPIFGSEGARGVDA